MANGVWHTGYHIKIELTHADLGHPDRPELLDEITLPIEQRDRELLQCLQHHGTGICRAEEEDRSPWMTIRRRTVDGVTTLVAAHLPVRTKPTADESDKHKALKERIARAAHLHGLSAQIEARSRDGKIRNDVLVSGSAGHIGWEAQYSPITASTVRRRSTAAANRGIMPLWVTNDDRAALIDRAPWVRVDDLPWRAIASDRAMLVRGGVRHLQDWACTPAAQRPCPLNGSSCGGLHVAWSLPALCLPPKPHTGVDALVAASAEGNFVPMKIPAQHNPRASTRLWAPVADRDRWRNIIGEDEALPDAEPPTQATLTFTEADLDATCRYGEDTRVFDDRRPRRDHTDASGLHTFPEVPQRIFRVLRQPQRLNISLEQRAEASRRFGCRIWHVGPCTGCGTPIHRYGPGSAHACAVCRRCAR
ncbi:competence protein CoiA family protein [Streptomyces sp. NPDC004778]